ncbi:hypothetical protein ACH5RR_022112 [Cinchona calisaya]|uniref:Protein DETOXIFICATION n=1 Tax=Cinchona calisaya TaxID=153742 RepID=A0ABD2Z6X7_9GENT
MEENQCDESVGNWRNKWWVEECKKTWNIALPAILTSASQFSIDFVCVVFAGHLGPLELAAVSEVGNVIIGFAYGVMYGMGSALETLSGQAFGAARFNMLGIYMQRSWIITLMTSLVLTPIYVFTSPILKVLRQDKDISELGGKYSVLVLPQLFAYALNFPMQKFLQSQSKIWVMTLMSIASMAISLLLNWVLVSKLGQGLLGVAMAGNVAWWVLVIGQMVYIVSGYFPEAWTGFSLLAFKSLFSFVKLSLSSAIMLCLELWYFTAVILMVGVQKNAANAVDAISICMNLQAWTIMVALGFNVAASVRVSNELGAGKPKAVKRAILVNLVKAGLLGFVFGIIVVATRNQFPAIFTDKLEVKRETSKLGYILALTIFLTGFQQVLQGVAVGAGWQFLVSMINIGCYYIVGVPTGALLGYRFKLGVQGIWWATLGGYLLQTIILVVLIFRTNWNKEALQAEERIKTWGGMAEPQGSS